MQETKNILVLAPHTDDAEFGCGASIAKFIEQGKQVTYIAFSSCSQSLPKGLPEDRLIEECTKSTKSLGIQNTRILNFEVRNFYQQRQSILEELIRIRKEFNPQTIFLPAQNDIHQDHQVIYAEGLRAFRNLNILGYELPWNNRRFNPNYFETVSESHLISKQNALKEYQSQSHRKYMNDELVRSLAIVRGIQCESMFAEAFEISFLKSQS
ncbi:MAG: PIG-L deacetylase family protein [Flavisolibacter sp.]